MPIKIPSIDDRRYQDLLDEALARIPVHTPEWTNFGAGDPGVTLIEVFAFLTESILYRARQIPERNRLKFLSLLGVGLSPASAARGLVQLANPRGPLRTFTLSQGVELRAGSVPFHTERGLDVLPIEAHVYYKKRVQSPEKRILDYYRQLYASYVKTPPKDPDLYETISVPGDRASLVDLRDALDGSLWIAVLARDADKPFSAELLTKVREAIGGRILSLGVVPYRDDVSRRLVSTAEMGSDAAATLTFEVPVGGALGKSRTPSYRPLSTRSDTDVLTNPGIVEIELPGADELTLWTDIDPLEAGVGEFPPPLEDTSSNARLVTWIRVRPTAPLSTKLLWVGINSTTVTQRARVLGEVLPAGTGEPDQAMKLTNAPVLSGTVKITVTDPITGTPEGWSQIDDLLSAGPEVPVPDPRLPPGAPTPAGTPVKVFSLDAEAGEIRFGDGAHGARPPSGAVLKADYDYSVGREGNLGAAAITVGPSLPSGITVTNPVPTWGGADAESAVDGERRISSYLRHRDRLVTTADFEEIALRTPGVAVGRVEVLPAYHPETGANEPGDAPGTVTLMVVPKYDVKRADAPTPDQAFLNAVCSFIDPRRLVTTEVFIRAPEYKSLWISIGLDVISGASAAEVREAVASAIRSFLSPLPPQDAADAARYPGMEKGWPLRKAVVPLELQAVASRVQGVLLVRDVLVAESGSSSAVERVALRGLELPRLDRISVVSGEPLSIQVLRDGASAGATGGSTTPTTVVPVPVVPEDCR